MGVKFNIAEILESVDLLITDKKYSTRIKKKIRNNYKGFTKKNIKMKDEKFEIDSIEIVKPDVKKSDTQVDDSVNPKKEMGVFEIDSIELKKLDVKKSDTQVDDPVTEKIIRDAEESQNNLKNENKISEINNEKVLILKDEFITTDIT